MYRCRKFEFRIRFVENYFRTRRMRKSYRHISAISLAINSFMLISMLRPSSRCVLPRWKDFFRTTTRLLHRQ